MPILPVLLILVALLSACRPALAGQDADGPTSTGETPEVPMSTEAAPEVLVEYRRTGGLIGADDHLVVRTGGEAVVVSRGQTRELVVDEPTLRELEATLVRASFPELEADYQPRRAGADLFEYAVTYAGKTVRARDTAVPDALQPVLQTLNRILRTP